MDPRDALRILAAHRGDRVVITTMSSIAVWPQFSDTPLDFAYIPSAMGHATSLGLGLALACPNRGVVVVNGDGGMLMNLGSLVTIANYSANLYVLIMDNQIYEVTGGQPTVGAGRIDFGGLASSAGIRRVYSFATLKEWQNGAAKALSGPGPVAIWLKIDGKAGQKTPKAPRPMAEQLHCLRQALRA